MTSWRVSRDFVCEFLTQDTSKRSAQAAREIHQLISESSEQVSSGAGYAAQAQTTIARVERSVKQVTSVLS